MKKTKAVKSMKIYNKGERRFVIAGSDLLEGGRREVNVHGVESGVIEPGQTVVVTAEKAKFLIKGYKGEVLAWGQDMGAQSGKTEKGK